VRAVTTTNLTSDQAIAGPGEVRATGLISGMPANAQVKITGTLYGPYVTEQERAADNCDKASASVERTWTGQDVHFTVEAVTPGFYAWRATTPPGELWLGSNSGCLAPGTTLRIQ
jgi:hypothetical protein